MFKNRYCLRVIIKTIVAGCACVIASAIVINCFIFMSAREFISDNRTSDNRDILIPGARVYANGKISDAYRDRLLTAVDISRENKKASFIVSADNRPHHYYESDRGVEFLTGQGVSKTLCINDPSGYTTLDTMIRARTIYGVKKVVIVTQRYHLYRSIFLARSLGIDAIGFPADRQNYRDMTYFLVREFFANVKAFCFMKFFAVGSFSS